MTRLAAISVKPESTGKIKIIISSKIPKGSYHNRNELCKIEMKFLFQKKNNKVIDQESNQRNNKESTVFTQDFGIIAVECPKAIKQIIGTCCHYETGRICNIPVNLKFFLQEYCY
jgi:hypothetical protein